jgi:hypothetical protein
VSSSEIIEFHWKAIARYDSYIATTNTKAAFLIAWNTFAIGSVGLKWSELLAPFATTPRTSVLATLCLLVVLLAGLVSLWETFRVVNPFVDSPKRPLKYHSLIFFRHVAEFESDEEFHAAVGDRSVNEVLCDLASQAYTLARALTFKFSALRRAIGLLLSIQLPALLFFILTRLIIQLTSI